MARINACEDCAPYATDTVSVSAKRVHERASPSDTVVETGCLGLIGNYRFLFPW